MIPLALPSIGKEEMRAALQVLKSSWLTHGEKNVAFEGLVRRYIGTKRAVSVNSCASALFLTLLAKGIRGEVLVPSFTFVASVNAIAACRAKPVFVDIEEETCNMDPSLMEHLLTRRTEAVMPVHYAGHPCNMKPIMSFARKHGLFVVEDAAECLGGEYFARKAGSFGDAGCLSFFPTKNITSCEGGMVVTNDHALADKVKALAGHGIGTTTSERSGKHQSWYRNAIYTGYNFRMSHVHAAIGLEQMKKAERLNNRRRTLAALYNSAFKNIAEIVVPVERLHCKHVYQMYVVRVPAPKRDAVVAQLNETGIGASVHFDPPVHHQTAYEKVSRGIKLPVTDSICKEVITLPLYPSLKNIEARNVSRTLIKALKTA